MKVCILTPYDPKKTFGGVETFSVSLRDGLREKGITANLTCPKISMPQSLQIATSLALIRQAKKAAKNYDIVHANKWISWLDIFFHTPCVATTHDTIYGWMNAVGKYMSPQHKLYRKLITMKMEKTGYRNAAMVAAVSKRTRQEVIRGYQVEPKRVDVVYNGIDPKFVMPKKSKQTLKKELNLGDNVLLFAGRADTLAKGFGMLLKIGEELRQRMDFELLVAGSVKRIKHFEKPDWIKVKRFKRSEMWKAYGAADVFVQSSRYEACSLVLLEAVVAGLPVISFNIGATPELLKDGKNGYIIPNFHTHKYADKAEKLLNSTTLRNKFSKNNKKLKKEFSVERMVDDYIKLYDKVL